MTRSQTGGTVLEHDNGDHHSSEDHSSGEQPTAAAGMAPMADQLDYLADMIHELRDIAYRVELATLGGILDLAYTEARMQSARAR